MRGNLLRYECLCGNDDVNFLPVANRRQNIETSHPSSILGDSMDLETTGPETSHSHSTESHLVNYEENKVVLPELVIPRAEPSRVTLPELQDELLPHLSDEGTRFVMKVEQIVDKMVDPLSCGRNNNPFLPDGFDLDVSGGAIDTDTNNDDNDVEITSSVPPKESRPKSQCPKCEEMVSTSNMSRHNKQYHRPGEKNHRRKFSSMPESVKIKCEFCGKGLARTSLNRHVREVHQGQRKRCQYCGKFFSFSHGLSIHEKSCSENPEKIKT